MTLERLGVPSEDVLGTNYTVTSLTVSNYNPTIDSTVTVTVTLKDVYNDPVVGEEVTVTASEGNFTQYNGSTITGASSYTGTTNSSGQFTLTYACSEWGLITFSANTETLQINVNGWRTIINDSNRELRVNGTFAEFRLHTDTAVYVDTTFATLTNWVPSEYAPSHSQYELADDGSYMARIDGTTVMYRSLSAAKRVNLYATFLYRY